MDDFWIFAVCTLLSKLRREERLNNNIEYESPRDLFFMALEYLKLSTVEANAGDGEGD